MWSDGPALPAYAAGRARQFMSYSGRKLLSIYSIYRNLSRMLFCFWCRYVRPQKWTGSCFSIKRNIKRNPIMELRRSKDRLIPSRGIPIQNGTFVLNQSPVFHRRRITRNYLHCFCEILNKAHSAFPTCIIHMIEAHEKVRHFVNDIFKFIFLSENCCILVVFASLS